MSAPNYHATPITEAALGHFGIDSAVSAEVSKQLEIQLYTAEARAEKAEAELVQLRAENDEMRVQIEANKRKGGGCQCADDEACAHVRRAERAEAEVERLLIIEKQFKQSRQEMKEDSK
jgi:multidrug resistance efflux pump